jgi:hypothetical protein
VGTFAQLLRDGLRLALLRRPKRTPLDAGFGHFAAFFLAATALEAAWQWPLLDAPRAVDLAGVQGALAAGLLHLAAVAVLAAGCGRRALFWTVASWLQCAWLVVTAVVGPLYVLDRHVDFALGFYAWLAALAWVMLVLLRLAAFLAGKSPLRAAAAALIAFAVLVGALRVMVTRYLWRSDGSDDFAEEPGDPPGMLDDPERTMYAQLPLLDRALSGLAPQRPGVVDLYAVAFGGDAGEDVFRNEVEYFLRLFAQRFDAAGRVLGLVNHPASASARPLATATNLERALRGVARRMDVEEDILFLYLTSHGTEDHWIYVNQPPLPLDSIDPRRLRHALDAAGVRWRVLVVSTCYSGGYVESLRGPRTLVITASRADRASFGCGADSEITWFGKAYLANALNATPDFIEAFALARKSIATWEARERFDASEPQIAQGAQIGAKLQAWRAGFVAGPALEFTPARD